MKTKKKKTALDKAKNKILELTQELEKTKRKAYCFDEIVNTVKEQILDELKDELQEIAKEEIDAALDDLDDIQISR